MQILFLLLNPAGLVHLPYYCNLPLWLLIGILVARAWRQPRALQSSGHQPEFLPGFTEGPERFYAKVYERLQADLEASQLPFGRLSFGPRRLFSRPNPFSPRCVYLEVRYRELSYLVYALPSVGGLHISSWLFSKHERMAEHPLLKWVLWWRLSRMTLFQYDIMSLFHALVSGAVNAVIDELRAEQGLRPLEAYERRPVLRGFYGEMQQSRAASYFDPRLGFAPGLLPILQQPVAQHSIHQQSVAQPPTTQPTQDALFSEPDLANTELQTLTAVSSHSIPPHSPPHLPPPHLRVPLNAPSPLDSTLLVDSQRTSEDLGDSSTATGR